jgi:hypothetical protein
MVASSYPRTLGGLMYLHLAHRLDQEAVATPKSVDLLVSESAGMNGRVLLTPSLSWK